MKVSKTCTFICRYCVKYLMLDRIKYRGVIFHDTEGGCKSWRKNELWFGKWHEECGNFSQEHLKVSKLRHWWDPLIQIRKSTSLKSTEELCVMTMENDAKFEEELTFQVISKLTGGGIWQILTWELDFSVLLLSKVYIVWAKKAQRSYLSWNWRGIQNLERNRLVFSKLT